MPISDQPRIATTSSVDKRKDSLSFPDSESSYRGERIRTSDLLNPIQAQSTPKVLAHEADTSRAAPGCTTGCTGEPVIKNEGMLKVLEAALLGLPMEDRARLAAMLLAQTAQAVVAPELGKSNAVNG